MVTDKVSFSNRNDKRKFSWTWNLPANVNNCFFHLALQCYFSLKTITCFCLTCVLAFLTKPSLGSQVCKGRYNVQQESRVKPVTSDIQKHCE